LNRLEAGEETYEPTPTRVFWKRGSKRLKTKDGSSQKKAKRRQAPVNKRVDVFEGRRVMQMTAATAGRGDKKRVGSEWWAVSSGRERCAAAGGRGWNFEIWAGTGATMGKGSAVLTWK
jgi:hypothetical protein